MIQRGLRPNSQNCVEGEFSEVGLPLYGVLRSSSQRTYHEAWAGSAKGSRPTTRRERLLRALDLNGPQRTSTLAQLVPTSFLASTMQMSRPLPPLAVSRVSPSATLILSEPPPPFTTSVSLVYLLAKTRSSPPFGTITSSSPSPIRSRILSSPLPP